MSNEIKNLVIVIVAIALGLWVLYSLTIKRVETVYVPTPPPATDSRVNAAANATVGAISATMGGAAPTQIPLGRVLLADDDAWLPKGHWDK